MNISALFTREIRDTTNSKQLVLTEEVLTRTGKHAARPLMLRPRIVAPRIQASSSHNSIAVLAEGDNIK